MSSRETIIAANWKMYKTIDEASAFVDTLLPLVAETKHTVYIAPPFTAIQKLSEITKNSTITIGAQNMNDATDGAFTGEIAARMLIDVGAKFVILGHSERRHIFGESSEFINKKVENALKSKLRPVLCIGETLEQRESGHTNDIIEKQLVDSLTNFSSQDLATLVIAYEPVWAIGTGQTATPKQAQEAHAFCRKILTKHWGPETADIIPILYGGSVKPDNINSLMDQSDIDGALVGGASLEAESFSKIINFQTINV